MVAVTTPQSARKEFKYNIAIPSSTFYPQFRNLGDLGDVYSALYAMGFDMIYEEAKAAEILAEAMNRYLRTSDAILPVISCSCPVIPRLVTAMYPNLIDNLAPFVSSHELAARIAKREFCETMDVPADEVGAFYISPCAAVMTHVRAPLGISKSSIDGVFSVRDMYAEMLNVLGKTDSEMRSIPFRAGAFGLGSAVVGGLSSAVGTAHYLAVDGMNNIIQCLDEIDNERLTELTLLEALACSGGCVGGPLTFENQFVAKNRNRRLANSQPRFDVENDEHIMKYLDREILLNDEPFTPHDVAKLSDNVVEAMKMLDRLEEINKTLPGLDCGSCGSPSCRTLAEDIVRGSAVEMDCIFKLRDKVRQMAQEMVDLAGAQKRG